MDNRTEFRILTATIVFSMIFSILGFGAFVQWRVDATETLIAQGRTQTDALITQNRAQTDVLIAQNQAQSDKRHADTQALIAQWREETNRRIAEWREETRDWRDTFNRQIDRVDGDIEANAERERDAALEAIVDTLRPRSS